MEKEENEEVNKTFLEDIGDLVRLLGGGEDAIMLIRTWNFNNPSKHKAGEFGSIVYDCIDTTIQQIVSLKERLRKLNSVILVRNCR